MQKLFSVALSLVAIAVLGLAQESKTPTQKTAMKDMPAGSYAMMPAEMRHFAIAKTAVTLQVHGMGPFVLNYVNPRDDPGKANAAK